MKETEKQSKTWLLSTLSLIIQLFLHPSTHQQPPARQSCKNKWNLNFLSRSPQKLEMQNLICHSKSLPSPTKVEVCQSLHTKSWLSILYAYKGLLLVVGVYMAWETRQVKISALNDSQYIGFSVYGAVITSFSVVVLANLLSEQVTLAFIIITSIILTSTTATLCLVFLPKMNDIWKKGKVGFITRPF